MRARRLRDSVVVITGAASGIGRAAALRFARKGATLVLTANQELALGTLAIECERLGARTLTLPAEASVEDALADVAQLAVGAFRRIDVWVNNAEESLFVQPEDTPPESFRERVEKTLGAYMLGARAALPFFRQQGGGVLINVSSVFGTLSAPYRSAYATSKYALRGLSQHLRQEGRSTRLRVVTVLPVTLHLPLLRPATTDRRETAAAPHEPLYAADHVARSIVRSARHPRRDAYVRGTGHRPRLLRTLVRRARRQPSLAPAHPDSSLSPAASAALSGAWRPPTPLRTGLLLGLLAVPVLLGWRWLVHGRGLFF